MDESSEIIYPHDLDDVEYTVTYFYSVEARCQVCFSTLEGTIGGYADEKTAAQAGEALSSEMPCLICGNPVEVAAEGDGRASVAGAGFAAIAESKEEEGDEDAPEGDE